MKTSKRIVAIMLTFTMIFSTFATVGFAGTSKWESVPGGEILIKDTVTKITDGVYEHEVVTNNSAGNDQKIDYLTEITPSDSLKIVSGYGKNNADKWSLTTTTKQAEAYEADNPGSTVVSGINADFFNMGTGEPLGALVMEGVVKHNSNGRHYFGITKDGQPVIRNTSDLSDLQTAVGGDALLINNGVIMTENTAYGSMNYSRTAIGIKADGTVVTFVTYGNRAPVSCGRTYMEIAEMLLGAGCTYALALDGGGSATLVSRPEGTTGLQLRNHPVDGAEREVSSSLLVVSTKEKTGVFSHAQLEPNNEVYTPGSEVQFTAKGVDTAGIAMDLPSDTKWALADTSKSLGSINQDTGLFTAGTDTGVVTVNLMQGDKVIGTTSIEIVVPDSIYFATEEVSLGFEEESDLGIVVRSKGRDVNYKVGDIVWKIGDEAAGKFGGNIFKTHDGNSVTTEATATSAYDDSVFGTIKVIVGKLPTIVWDFEDKTLEDGTVIEAEEYYVNGYKTVDEAGAEVSHAGILNTSNYGRGGKQSIEIVDLHNDEPVRFGANSLKLNYDFTQCGAVTEGACIGTSNEMAIPGVPTGIGVWVYAPEGVGIEWQGQGTQAGFWLRGYVVDGSGAVVPYDFTLEPKVIEEGSGKQPGIYWEGWKYLEADLTKLSAPFKIRSGMTFRLMYVAGTQMGTKSANSIYFDNLQFVYGTNVDDIDNPVIDSITANGTELVDDSVINTNVLNIDSIVSDVENKYTSGVDDKTVRMYIDGVNVVGNDKYEYAYADSIAHLYNLKLKDGEHSITVTIRDAFGNETSETRHFVVDTESAEELTTVEVVPAGEAILGGTIDLQVKASDATVVDSTTAIKLGNQFKEYEVIYSDNYVGETTYSKLTKNININAERKEEVTAEDNNVIATLRVKIPSNLLESDVFSYTVKSGKFETANGQYDTYATKEIKMPIKAGYTVNAEPIIVGGEKGVINVSNAEGKPAKDVTVYLVADGSAVGVTDENGQIVTEQFNTTAGEYAVYAKTDDGLLSFQYKLYSYAPQGDATGVPHNIRFNATNDATTKENISWMSNPLVEGKQVLQYAVSGSDQWTTIDAKTEQIEFGYHGFNVVDVNSVLIDGLTPGTTYDYKVGTEGAMSETKTFTTDVNNRDESKFFILGDIQDSDKTNLTTIVDKLNDVDYNFGIQIGDAIDQANDYTDWADLGNVVGEAMLGDTDMISVMGNHEYYGDGDASIASSIYNNPTTKAGSHYSFENGNIYFAVINFCDTSTQIKEAAEWLKADAAKSDAIWKVVLTHQPAYFTNSVGGNDPVYDYLPAACEAAGIDAVFSGHDHSFARTNPLVGDKVDEDNGIVYYVTGAIGSKRYPVSTGDKFDYPTIFNYMSDGFDATYLTVDSNKDEMTIKMFELGNEDPVNVCVIESECKKNDHKLVYDKEKDIVKCSVCKDTYPEYTGDVKDTNGNEYYFLAGKIQTGWTTVGEDMRYYDENGIREKVTVETGIHTCIIPTVYTYTSESGAVKEVTAKDAGGHEYVETDGKFICSVCGWQRVKMEDCEISLNYSKVSYTGEKKFPVVTAVNPITGDVLERNGDYGDYKRTYKNNVEVGTASIVLAARKHGYYVNINEYRGNYEGSTTIYFDICPDAPKNALVAYEDDQATIMWDAAKAADKYVIYQSTNGGKTYKAIGTTTKCKYVVKNLDDDKSYNFKVGSRATGLDKNQKEKSYDSVKKATVYNLRPTVKVSYSDNGKPVLKWTDRKDVTYVIYRATSKTGTYRKMLTTGKAQYTNTSAKAGKTYYYKVVAKLDDYTSTSKIYSAIGHCEQPEVTAKYRISDGKPKLVWDKVSGASKYVVYRSTTGKDGSFKKTFTTTGTSYVNSIAKVGKTYYYKVAAIEKVTGEATLSEVVSKTCKPERVVVTASISKTSGKPRLTWEAVAGAVKYEIYRSTTGKDGSFKKQYTATSTRYTNTTAKAGRTYYYKVRAVTSNDVTGYFSTVDKVTCQE